MEQGVWSSHVGVLRHSENIYPNFALQLNQGPTFSSEIRSCMHIHLVELEAMQAVSSLQNGCTAPTLN